MFCKFCLIFLICKFIFSHYCSHNDIGNKYTICENNVKTLFSYWLYDCIKENIDLPKPVYNISCELTCPRDQYLGYKDGSASCLSCPPNTLTDDKVFRLKEQYKEITKLNLKNFDNNCYVLSDSTEINNLTVIRNKNCSSWNPDNNNWIESGNNSRMINMTVFTELVYGVNLNKDGFIEFIYDKQTYKKHDFINGRFQFHLDYEILINDNEINTDKKHFRFNLTKGFHLFLWQYGVYYEENDNLNNALNAKIHDILIDGVEYNGHECINFNNNVTSMESEYTKCEINHYYDLKELKCMKCPNNSVSYPKSIGIKSCFNKKICTKEDFTPFLGKCDKGKALLQYTLNSKFCDDDKMTQFLNRTIDCSLCSEGEKLVDRDNIKCEKCENGKYSNMAIMKENPSKCLECKPGEYSPLIIRYEGITFLERFNTDFQHKCNSIDKNGCFNRNGFIVDEESLYSGKDLTPNLDLDLILYSNFIDTKSQISFEITLSFLEKNETFFFFINDKLTAKYNESGNYNQSFSLNREKYKFKWRYQRDNSFNNQIAVIFNYIELKGSENGFSSSCFPCPKGTVRDFSNTENNCILCKKGYVPNLKSI